MKKIFEELPNLDLPYLHISIALLITVLLFIFIFFAVRRRNKLIWLSFIIFFSIYLILILSSIYEIIDLQMSLFKFRDFSMRSENEEYLNLLKDYTNDTGRLLIPFLAIFPSALLGAISFLIGKIVINTRYNT